jgi:NADH-quinone oxidoreductase subunit N
VLEQTLNSLKSFIPETVLIVSLIVCIILDLILRKKSAIVSVAGIIGILISAYFAWLQLGMKGIAFSGMVVIDPYSVFFKMIFALSTIFIIIFALFSKEIFESTHKNEHVYLMIALALGANLMASSVNLLMMYLSLETVSITSYILSGYNKKVKRSSESAMKYVIYGAASSGIMIYGISLLYGFTGSLNIFEISMFLSKVSLTSNPLMVICIVMILAGFGYKISSVPFHFWTPDVYEGAPIPVTAFLAVTSSAAGFAVLIRFFTTTFLQNGMILNGKFQIIPGVSWPEIIIVLSVASMILGNFVAVWQTSVKRMLAYSSIAQGGYIMLGLVVANQQGITAMLIYLIAYLFMNLGAFFVLILIANKLDTDELIGMKGLGYKAPVICIAMAVFMFSLSGIPSTVGFVGKFYLFSALIDSKMFWLALVALMNSVVSLFFYIKVLKYMFLMKPDEGDTQKLQFGTGAYIMLFVLVVPTMFFGLYFAPLVRIAEFSVSMFGIK